MPSSPPPPIIQEYAVKVIRHQAQQLVGTAGFTADDRADLEQELLLDVLKRWPKYDARKGTPKTFVARIVVRRISTLLRHRTCAQRDHQCAGGSLNEPLTDRAGECRERGDLITQEEADLAWGRAPRQALQRALLRLDVAAVLAPLPAPLRRLGEHLQVGSISDAARSLGRPRTTVHDQVKVLRDRFLAAGLEDYC